MNQEGPSSGNIKATLQSQSSTFKSTETKKFESEDFDEKAVFLCQFCGGERCPQEDFKANKIQPNAIEGLHSNWITHNILAMQRPSDRLIKQYNLYEKFKTENINTILNLQEPGEHPYCGDGLLTKVGFSYDPEGFYANGIKFFNESWEDMTATTFDHMMRIMNIFYLSLVQEKGKISVHCHAGRGRTLLVICSWLIYWDRINAQQTINLATQRRQGVLTRSSQREFLKQFEQELRVRWICFGNVCGKSFGQFVETQKVSLLKHEQSECRYKPYLHTCVINQLRRRLSQCEKSELKQLANTILSALLGFADKSETSPIWTEKDEQILKSFKKSVNEHTLFSQVPLPEDKAVKADTKTVQVKVLTELLLDFYDGIAFTPFNAYSIEFIKNSPVSKSERSTKVEILHDPEFVHEAGVEAIAVLLDWIHFLKQVIVNSELSLVQEGSNDIHKIQCLFLRISLLLTSKRKFHPKLFSSKSNLRECKLLTYTDERKKQKYAGPDAIILANYMRSLTKQIPEQVEKIDDILKKTRKIDHNLAYFTSSHESAKGFFKQQDVKGIYEKSKV